MTLTAGMAFVAAAVAPLGAADLLGSLGPVALARLPRLRRGLTGLVEAVVRLGSEGRDPGALERRRLLAAGAGAALLGGSAIAGPVVGLVLATAGPWTVSRALRARRAHYRRAVDEGAAEIAIALADALAAGASLRAAVQDAARGVGGQAGHELRRSAAELAVGAPTAAALADLRDRTQSPRVATLVAACLVQGNAGGNLARLLRECAVAFGDQARLEAEARSATAQARFTGLLVALLPLGGALLAELASPGFLAGLSSSWLTAWLVGLALAMQVGAALAIRRLGRVTV